MPAAEQIQTALRSVNDQVSFLHQLLGETLGWPIPEDTASIEDISYEWPLDDFRAAGLEDVITDGRIYQFQPFDPEIEQPWAIFIIEFIHSDLFLRERGMTGILRTLLQNLVVKSRQDPQRPAWKREHLLFICTHEYRNYRFAYFKTPQNSHRAPLLATFGWNAPQPARTVCEYNLKELEWPGPADVEDSSKWVSNWSKAFDVERVTKQFFNDYSDVFSSVEQELEETITDHETRRLFVQRLFNRLMFLRFVERKGWLNYNGRTDYLQALHSAGGINGESLFKSRIVPLFFEALAVPGAQESEAVGSVKYLNGGLFTRTPEDDLVEDIPDRVFEWIIGSSGLFYLWNFTVEEATPLHVDVAVDPEMLGKVFEKLVTARKEKGSYYTPREIVSFMCRETLKGYLGGYEELVDKHDGSNITVSVARELIQKLKRVRVIDPACGSGAYLVGMLHELHSLNKILDTRAEEATPRDDYNLKLSIIQNNLYGVDIEEFAANTACLRLWLSLAVEFEGDDPEPLPNLDFKIGIGDSLTAPDPHLVNFELVHERVRIYADLKRQYSDGHLTNDEKIALSEEIEVLKEEICEWVRPGVSVGGFDWAIEFAEVFLPQPAESTISEELNLGNHLAASTIPGGFDIAIANPPYGASVDSSVRSLYFNRSTDGSQSKDTYGLFMARALQLLREGGQFSFIVSDTWRTIRSHLPLRKRLITESLIKHVLDLPSWVFDATVNTCILTLTKLLPNVDHALVAGDLRSLPVGDWKLLSENLLAVASHGFDAQTITYSRYTYKQNLLNYYVNAPVFIGSPKLYRHFVSNDNTKLGDIAEVKHGLTTGNTREYVYKRAGQGGSYREADQRLVFNIHTHGQDLSDEEKQNGIDPVNHDGRYLIPYDKGGASSSKEGWLPCYNVKTPSYIDWRKSSVDQMKTLPGFRHDGREYYFRKGITFSHTGFYSPTFRLGCSGVFDTAGSSLFPHNIRIEVLLGILNSKVVRYLFKTYINHTVNSAEDPLKEIPIPVISESEGSAIAGLVRNIIDAQERNQSYQYQDNEQKRIEVACCEVYDLTSEDIREIELWYCRRYPKLAEAQGAIEEAEEKYSEYLSFCDHILSQPPEYWRSHPVLAEIAEGEGQSQEFKETLEWDVRNERGNAVLRKEVLKTICAFLNTNEGKLFIGVSDVGKVVGLEQDFRLCGRHQNADGFEQKLRNLMQNHIEPAPLGQVEILFHIFPEGRVCEMRMSRSTEISHLDGEEIYVRDGNRSVKLQGRTRTDWIQHRE